MELTQRQIDVFKKEKALLELVNITLDKINYALDQDQISEAVIELALAMRDEGYKKAIKECKQIILDTK